MAIDPINPGFESGLTGWSVDPAPFYPPVSSTWDLETDPALVYAGAASLRWTGDSTDPLGSVGYLLFYHDQKIGLPTNSSGVQGLMVGIHLRILRDGGPDGFATCGVGIASYDQDDTRLSEIRDTSLVLGGGNTDTGWVRVNIPFVSTPGAYYYKLFVHAQSRAGRTLLYDNLEWDAVEPYGPTPQPPTPPPPPTPAPAPQKPSPQAAVQTANRRRTTSGMPKEGAPIADGRGLITREWRDFLSRLLSEGLGGEFQEQIDQINTKLYELGADGAFLPSSTRAYGESSIASFGTLAGGLLTFTLQNDADSPGEKFYYGTGPDGAKGWFPLNLSSLADVDVPAPNDGDALVWSEADQKWIASPVSFSFGNALTDESGNILTDQDGNVLTDGRLTIDWADVENKPAFGSAALQPSSAFATAAQGALADTALQSVPALSTQSWAPYTLATLPSVTPPYRSIYVTDLSGTPGPCYTDGTNWRRYSDDSIAT